MNPLAIKPNEYDFSAVRKALQGYVDQQLLAGVSYAILQGREVIDVACIGAADIVNKIALREDHLFRIYSNTKLITSCAVLLLYEEGHFQLDDPIERFIPQLANRRVLKLAATTLDDTEPANGSITIRHLLTHMSGLGYGVLDPGTLLFKAFTERKILSAMMPLSEMIEQLAPLPLLFHPGTAWEYSISIDVLGRLVEIVSGQRFDAFLRARIFAPLGMVDTGFHVPTSQHHRLTAYYKGADVMKPMKPGLTRIEHPYPGAYLQAAPRHSGGGGLVSTLSDMVALVRGLLPGGDTLLKPATLTLMMTNQLPAGRSIGFPTLGPVPGKGHGLAGAVTLQPNPFNPPNSIDEFQWGGIGGTHWWISPRTNLSAVLMTQRHMGFWHPFAFEFKKLVYAAAT